MTEKEVYSFYQEFVKPIYSEIEARWNDIPVELLFESYAALDHLKRFHLNEGSEAESCTKALSHLKRGVLDAFKLKLKYFNIDVEHFLKSSVDFQLIDNGRFISSFYRDRAEIIQVAKQARLTESQNGKELAFEGWFSVSQKIDEFEHQYFSKVYEVEWAKTKTIKLVNKDSLRGFLIGLASGILSSLLVAFVSS